MQMRKSWTTEEEEALRAGIAKHGTGKWKNIQKDPNFSHLLHSRSNIDLKDKWRNMSQTATGQRSREKSRTLKLKSNPDALPTPVAITFPSSTPAPATLDASLDVAIGDKTDSHDHPMYNQMIVDVAASFKDTNGSESSAILSFIEGSRDASIGNINGASEKDDNMENDSVGITEVSDDQLLRVLCSEGNINGASEKDDNMEDDSVVITEVSDDQLLSVLCSAGGILNQLNGIKETRVERSQHNYQELPFMKICSLWETVDSIKEFQMIKHFPHFNDLLYFEEHCREGLAIGKIVIFKNLLNEGPNLKLDDPQCLWDNYCKVLLDLEMNGFAVLELKVRFENLLVFKYRHQRNQDELKKHEVRLLEEENKKRKIDEEMEELNDKFMKIQEKRAAMISIKEVQDSKTATSQLATNELLKDIRSTQLDIERVIATPQLTLM